MQHPQGKHILALIVGLAVGASAPALAQDTTETGQATIDTTAPDLDAMDAAEADTAAADTAAADTSAADTAASARDTTDTSGVRNPPGFRGMERDTTIFPDSAGPPVGAEAVEDQTTGTYSDSAWQDTTGAAQNPAGYRGMERPVDSAGVADSAGTAETAQPAEKADSADHPEGAGHTEAADTTRVGETEPMEEEAATPRLDPSESSTGGEAADTTE